MMNRFYTLLTLMLCVSVSNVFGATYTVTDTTDSPTKSGTLRWAIKQANGTPTTDRIVFNAALKGKTIKLDSALTIIYPAEISADVNGDKNPDVLLYPTSKGQYSAFNVHASECVIEGFSMYAFERCVEVTGDKNTVRNNYLGVPMDGKSIPLDFTNYGIVLIGSNNVVGPNNVIGNTSNAGVSVQEGLNNTIKGNYIGISKTSTAMPNKNGIEIIYDLSENTRIGGTIAADRNVISGNTNGIYVANNGNHQILGNYIGTDVSGMSSVPNTYGISLVEEVPSRPNSSSRKEAETYFVYIGDGTAQGRNIISGNNNAIYKQQNYQLAQVEADFLSGYQLDMIVNGNYIGLAADGKTQIIGSSGILISTGSYSVIKNNKIIGCTYKSIYITDSYNNEFYDNIISGTADPIFIGTNAQEGVIAPTLSYDSETNKLYGTGSRVSIGEGVYEYGLVRIYASVSDGSSNSVEQLIGTATVNFDRTWEFELEGRTLPAGYYNFIANQTVGMNSSSFSTPVTCIGYEVQVPETLYVCTDQAELEPTTIPTYTSIYWSKSSGSGDFLFGNNHEKVTVSGLKQNTESKFYIQVSNNSCTSTDTVVVSRYSPDAGILSEVPYKTTTSNPLLTLTIGLSGTWKSLNGNATIVKTSSVLFQLNGLTPGLNTFEYTGFEESCLPKDTLYVIYQTDFIPVNAGKDRTLCPQGGNTYSVQLESSVPGLKENGRWSSVNPQGVVFENDTLYNTKVNFTTIGTYSLVWTITNKQTRVATTDTVIVSILYPPYFYAPSVDYSCDSTASFYMYDTQSYKWYSPENTALKVLVDYQDQYVVYYNITGLNVGENKIIMEYQNGECSVKTGFTIDRYPTPVVNAGPDLFISDTTLKLFVGNNQSDSLSWTWYSKTLEADSTYFTGLYPKKNTLSLVKDIRYDQGTCSASDEVNVYVLEDGILAVTEDYTDMCGDNSVVEAVQPLSGQTGVWKVVDNDPAKPYITISDSMALKPTVSLSKFFSSFKLAWVVTNGVKKASDTLEVYVVQVDTIKAFNILVGSKTSQRLYFNTNGTVLGQNDISTSFKVLSGTAVKTFSPSETPLFNNLSNGSNVIESTFSLGDCKNVSQNLIFKANRLVNDLYVVDTTVSATTLKGQDIILDLTKYGVVAGSNTYMYYDSTLAYDPFVGQLGDEKIELLQDQEVVNVLEKNRILPSSKIKAKTDDTNLLLQYSSKPNYVGTDTIRVLAIASEDTYRILHIRVKVVATLAANAGTDFSVCDSTGKLAAEQVTITGATAKWLTPANNDAVIKDLTSPTSDVSFKKPGRYSLVWQTTLGANISNDTVLVDAVFISKYDIKDTIVVNPALTLKLNPTPATSLGGSWSITNLFQSSVPTIGKVTADSVRITDLYSSTMSFVWTYIQGTCIRKDTVKVLYVPIFSFSKFAGADKSVCGLSSTLEGDTIFSTNIKARWYAATNPTDVTISNPNNRNSSITFTKSGNYSIVRELNYSTYFNRDTVVITAIIASEYAINDFFTVLDSTGVVAKNRFPKGESGYSMVVTSSNSAISIKQTSSADSVFVKGLVSGLNTFNHSVDAKGCTASGTFTIDYFPFNQLTGFAGKDTIYCSSPFTMPGVNVNGVTSTWKVLNNASDVTIASSAYNSSATAKAGTYAIERQINLGNLSKKDTVNISVQDLSVYLIADKTVNNDSTVLTILPSVPSSYTVNYFGNYTFKTYTSKDSVKVKGLNVGQNSISYEVRSTRCSSLKNVKITYTPLVFVTADAGRDTVFCKNKVNVKINHVKDPNATTSTWTALGSNSTDVVFSGDSVKFAKNGDYNLEWYVKNQNNEDRDTILVKVRSLSDYTITTRITNQTNRTTRVWVDNKSDFTRPVLDTTGTNGLSVTYIGQGQQNNPFVASVSKQITSITVPNETQNKQYTFNAIISQSGCVMTDTFKVLYLGNSGSTINDTTGNTSGDQGVKLIVDLYSFQPNTGKYTVDASEFIQKDEDGNIKVYKSVQALGVMSSSKAIVSIVEKDDSFFIEIAYNDKKDFKGLDSIQLVVFYENTTEFRFVTLRVTVNEVINTLTNKVVVYNGISPDKVDDKNDKLEFDYIHFNDGGVLRERFGIFILTVFDRSSNVLVELDGYDKVTNWDGGDLPSGTYYYRLLLGDPKDPNESTYNKKPSKKSEERDLFEPSGYIVISREK